MKRTDHGEKGSRRLDEARRRRRAAQSNWAGEVDGASLVGRVSPTRPDDVRCRRRLRVEKARRELGGRRHARPGRVTATPGALVIQHRQDPEHDGAECDQSNGHEDRQCRRGDTAGDPLPRPVGAPDRHELLLSTATAPQLTRSLLPTHVLDEGDVPSRTTASARFRSPQFVHLGHSSTGTRNSRGPEPVPLAHGSGTASVATSDARVDVAIRLSSRRLAGSPESASRCDGGPDQRRFGDAGHGQIGAAYSSPTFRPDIVAVVGHHTAFIARHWRSIPPGEADSSDRFARQGW